LRGANQSLVAFSSPVPEPEPEAEAEAEPAAPSAPLSRTVAPCTRVGSGGWPDPPAGPSAGAGRGDGEAPNTEKPDEAEPGAAADGAADSGSDGGHTVSPVDDPSPDAPSLATSASAIGLRMTTGGMGRDPGMLIRMRVVSVVSVRGSSDSTAAVGSSFASAPSWPSEGSEAYGLLDPYGGVPEGYAVPPRPCAPEDELSVSRLKAGSPGWLHRPFS
jgi:hypothetical protein